MRMPMFPWLGKMGSPNVNVEGDGIISRGVPVALQYTRDWAKPSTLRCARVSRCTGEYRFVVYLVDWTVGLFRHRRSHASLVVVVR